MEKLILVFRGHIRTAFDNTKMKELVELLNKSYSVEIYMQTWDKQECENTWRNVDKRLQCINVTEDMIYNYFGQENKHLIKKILIQDETKIKLVGNTEGCLKRTSMPVKGWKNFVYGLNESLNMIPEELRHEKNIISMRIDMMMERLFHQYHVKFREEPERMVEFFVERIQYMLKRYWFKIDAMGPSIGGYDNCLFGNYDHLQELFYILNNHLDEIIEKYHSEGCMQEKIVYDIVHNLKKNKNFYNFLKN